MSAPDFENRDREEAKECVKVVSNFLNRLGREPQDFVEAFGREHRSLQQNFTRLCAAWLRKLAEMEKAGLYDLRNEASCKLARELKPIIDKHGLPYV